ncbi:MAG: methylenetetrahydrofolate reductase [NAD(P)H] [Planctomycetota bacterium]|nr:MAG: methylenetetrahydrofolate reductase [NAD(P)H] [Planctomycetota bacterium]
MSFMRLDHILQRGKRCLSYEFFPPKSDRAWYTLEDTITQLAGLGPDFVSVTYGAGGSTRAKTREVIEHIQRNSPLTAMAHLTCVGATVAEIRGLLDEYHHAGIENILALRGDPPRDQGAFTVTPGGCAHSNELLQVVAADGRFASVGAAYPEGHPDSPSREEDWGHLLEKFDNGACAAITQCIFDSKDYCELLQWVEHRRKGSTIIPGILTVVDYPAIERFSSFCGATIPQALKELMEPLQERPSAARAAGIAYTIHLCRELLDLGAPGIHIYALNRSTAAAEITTALRDSGHLPQPYTETELRRGPLS